MKFQDVLNTVQSAENGKTVLCHCSNWPKSIWVAFKLDETSKSVCNVFIRKEDGMFGTVSGARFTEFEIVDIMAEWEVKTL